MTNKEAIAILENLKIQGKVFFSQRLALDLAIKALEDRPQGEWQLHGMIYYCSECGHECGESGDNFCGNCGADMRRKPSED